MFLDRIPFDENVVVVVELVYPMIFQPISPIMDPWHERMVSFSLFLRLTWVPLFAILENRTKRIKS